MIDPDAAQPERSERSNLDRGDSRPAAELLPRVLEALPLGVAIFELGAEGFRFRYGNRGFARVLALERMPSAGQPVGEVFDRADHDAVVELFRLVRVSREPQSYFAAEGGRGPSPARLLNIDAYPLLTAGRFAHVLIPAHPTTNNLTSLQRQQL